LEDEPFLARMQSHEGIRKTLALAETSPCRWGNLHATWERLAALRCVSSACVSI